MYRRALLPCAAGLAAAALCLAILLPQGHAADLTWPLRGARLLLASQNPYTDPTIGPGNPYPADAPLYYPLTALMLVVPLVPLPLPWAAALFSGLSVGLLTYAYRKHPALLGMLISVPLLISIAYGQWGPLLTAAAALPQLGFLLTAKPAVGAALWLWKPNRRALAAILSMGLVSLVFYPAWPLFWLANLGQGRHTPPIWTLPLLLIGLLRWRDERARLIVLLSFAPQFAGSVYDHLPLFLAMRTRRQGLILAACSWLGVLLDVWLDAEWLLVLSTYGASLVLVWFSRSVADQRVGP